jgi:hypothetical protein
MATRAQLRTTLRERLEDTSGSPLWADASLNEFLIAAVRAYGVRFPKPSTAATSAIVSGVTSIALPAGVPETAVVAVRDGRGRDVPPATERFGPAPVDATGLAQGWRVWSGMLRLQRPATGDEVGAWAIDYMAGRELVADDVSAQPIEAGDEPIVIALAAAQALERQSIEDAKRSTKASPAEGPATKFRAEADQLISARKRRVRGGYVSAT